MVAQCTNAHMRHSDLHRSSDIVIHTSTERHFGCYYRMKFFYKSTISYLSLSHSSPIQYVIHKSLNILIITLCISQWHACDMFRISQNTTNIQYKCALNKFFVIWSRIDMTGGDKAAVHVGGVIYDELHVRFLYQVSFVGSGLDWDIPLLGLSHR